jgi:hypothetical protein
VGTDAAAHPAPTVEAVIRHRLSVALGGWRGSVETALPTVAFLVLWTWHKNLVQALVAAGVVVGVLMVVRLAQRQVPHHVVSAAVVTAIAAFFALRSGHAEAVFLPGILWNAACLGVALLSVATRWPLVGFMVGVGDPRMAEDPVAWHRDPALVRVCQRLTLVLAVVYAIRLAVMVPLYLNHEVTALGVAKLALGWPLWLAGVATMAWMLLRGETPQEVPAPDSAQTPQTPQTARTPAEEAAQTAAGEVPSTPRRVTDAGPG